jgi:hypothetical protein
MFKPIQFAAHFQSRSPVIGVDPSCISIDRGKTETLIEGISEVRCRSMRMKRKNIFSVTLLICLLASGASAQGLLGERYMSVGVIYEDYDFDGYSVDGRGAGIRVNVPVPGIEGGPFGLDLRGGLSYFRMTEGWATLDAHGIFGSVRGHAEINAAVRPYLEAGLGWSRSRISGFGWWVSDSTLLVPLEFGVEVQAQGFSLAPFFGYTIAVESGYDDSWSIGVTAAYWFTPVVGAQVTFAHTDYDDNVESIGISVGVMFGF